MTCCVEGCPTHAKYKAARLCAKHYLQNWHAENRPGVLSQQKKSRALEGKRRVEAGEHPEAIAEEFGVHRTTVYKWVWGGQKPKVQKKKHTVKKSPEVVVPHRIINSVFALGHF